MPSCAKEQLFLLGKGFKVADSGFIDGDKLGLHIWVLFHYLPYFNFGLGTFSELSKKKKLCFRQSYDIKSKIKLCVS